MKRDIRHIIYWIILLLVLIIAVVIFLQNVNVNVKYSFEERVVNKDEFGRIVSKRENESKVAQRILFDGQELIYSVEENTFYYSLLENNIAAYNPKIEIITDDGKADIAINQIHITEDVIRDNIGIPFIIYTDCKYSEHRLVCTTLPVMNISSFSDISDEKSEMTIYLFDNRDGVTNRVTFSDGSIHIRGGLTRMFPKKSYRISLTEQSLSGHKRKVFRSLLGMRSDDDWILYAAYNDQEKVRNVFSQNLWKYSCSSDNADGIETGSEYKYVEVFLNGDYHGLYALGYPIDEKLLDMNEGQLGEVLYKKVKWIDEQTIPLSDTLSEIVTGYEIKSPNTKTDQWGLLKDYYSFLSKNTNDNDSLYKGIDLNNAADVYLFYNLIQGTDNVGFEKMKNTLMAIFNTKESVRTLYCPWDMDYSWGNGWTENSEENATGEYCFPPDYNVTMNGGCFGQLLLNNDIDAWNFVFEKYETLRKESWSETAIDAMIDAYEEDIFDSGAYCREMERWEGGTYLEDSSVGLCRFKKYVHQRIEEFDKYLSLLEENLYKSCYVKKALQYKDFLEDDYFIEINDMNILNDFEYVDLLEYIGVNISKITSNIQYIIGNCENGYVYASSISDTSINDSGSDDSNEDALCKDGRIIISNQFGRFEVVRTTDVKNEMEEEYSVYINGTLRYNYDKTTNPAIRLFFKNNDSIIQFNFYRRFTSR